MISQGIPKTTKCIRAIGRGYSSFGTDRTEECILCDVFGHPLVLSRQRHDEQQCISGLLAHCALPVDEGDEQGEDEEVGGSLILAGVEKQLQY